MDYNNINEGLYSYSDNYDNNCGCNSNTFNNDRNNFFCPDIRTELIINQNSQTVCNILQELNCQDIQIDGYSLQAINDKCTVFRFVVGGPNEQSLTDIDVAKAILCELGVKFLEAPIIKVNTNNNFNLADTFCALQRNVDVAASYYARTTGAYFQVDEINEALSTLRRCG